MNLLDLIELKKQYAIFLEMFTYPFPILLRKIGKAARNKIFPSPAEVFDDTRFQSSVLITEKYLSTKKLDISHIDKNIAIQALLLCRPWGRP